MKKTYILIALLIVTFSCKNQETKIENISEEIIEQEKKYPENLTKIFDAHGGIEQWKSMKSLVFTIEKSDGKEVTSTNLETRESLIKSPKRIIGFNGEKPWIINKTKGEYRGYNPKYYYNLMFYFYTMPFILSDDGINYGEAEPLVFNGVTYPGIEITYNDGVGETPEDVYVLYYNPTTYQMEWLGYTVSFVPNIDKTELHFRKYSQWQTINGLLLPKTIVSYGYRNDEPTVAKSTTEFTRVRISEKAIRSSKFAKPDAGKFVE